MNTTHRTKVDKTPILLGLIALGALAITAGAIEIVKAIA